MIDLDSFFAELASIQWLDPWKPIERGHGGNLTDTLALEVGPRHPLFRERKSLVPVARRVDTDDVLFLCLRSDRLADVHLTWRGSRHWFSATWPWAVFYSSLEEWVEKGMKRDYLEVQESFSMSAEEAT